MKVWGLWTFIGTPPGQKRTLVAAKSQRVAVEALRTMNANVSLYAFRQFASETRNEEERAVALTRPGAVFYRMLDSRGSWSVADRTEQPQ